VRYAEHGIPSGHVKLNVNPVLAVTGTTKTIGVREAFVVELKVIFA
jgi:hypothetical protein